MKAKSFNVKSIVLTGLFIAIGVILPRLLPLGSGMMLLPMHIPVLLCGLLCGIPYGIICGLVVPLISHFTVGMPQVPMLYAMLFELAAYGAVAGLVMKAPVKSYYGRVQISLYVAMLLGRIVFGAVNALIFNIGDYSLNAWLTASFVTAAPGIVIQVVLIPPVVLAVNKIGR